MNKMQEKAFESKKENEISIKKTVFKTYYIGVGVKKPPQALTSGGFGKLLINPYWARQLSLKPAYFHLKSGHSQFVCASGLILCR